MSPFFWKAVLDWVPFLVFIGLLVFFMTRLRRKQGDYMTFMQKYCADHLEETRRIGDSLQRIAAALERSRDQR